MGLIWSIVIGGVAGWLAALFMKSGTGLIMNVILGMVGAFVAGWLFSFIGVSFAATTIGYLVSGFVGAVILIFIGRRFF